MYGKRHFTPQLSPTFEWKPSVKTVGPISHEEDRVIGLKKIITSYTIVKPRVERVHFVEKTGNEKSSGGGAGASLEDFMSGKMFLQKNRGVKARMMEETVRQRREEER